jgi:predicted CXXCH cytochrome family protein
VTSGCLDCHGTAGDALDFADGTSKSVFVEEKVWQASAHATRLTCRDCHPAIQDHPHPELTAPTPRDHAVQLAQVCQNCHKASHARALDSIHFALAAKDKNAAPPICTDCHGAHDTLHKPARSLLNQACSGCHPKLYAQFGASAHGKALVGDDPDVPGCIDCHSAHAADGPRPADARAASFEMCARCHGDSAKMTRHQLNTDVLATYLEDFHGVSNRLYAMGAGTPARPIAVCIDCHGIHDIARSGQGHDTADARARVTRTCQKCHRDAPPQFADAWLSHHRPTLAGAPLLWAVKWTYRLMIPFILAGLVTHILLHLWRVRTHR